MLFMKKRKDKESKKSNKKKISNISIISFILIISIGIFILFNIFNADNEKCERIENGYCILEGVPEYLKFQEPVAIENNELWNFSEKPFSDYFVLKNPDNTSEGYLCADKESPYEDEVVYYFVKGCDDLSDIRENCPYRRAAIICDTFYYVGDSYVVGYGNVTKESPYEL